MKAPAIEFASNYIGFLPSYLKSALYNYLEFPNHDNWDDIYSYVISTGKTATVWQAVIAVDPTFPTRISKDSEDCARWDRIPSAELVSKAIAKVVFADILKKHVN